MNNEEEIISRIKRFLNREEGAYATGEDIQNLLKLYEDKKEEMYAIARANYILGQTEERSQWYKKINEKIEEHKQERNKKSKDDFREWGEFNAYDWENYIIRILKELIGKEE